MSKFEVGMEVIINPRSHGDVFEFNTIKTISPSGRIVTLSDGRKFNGDNGREYGHTNSRYYERIEPATDEVKVRVARIQAHRAEVGRRNDLMNRVEGSVRSLSADQLQQVADLIATFSKPK